MTDGDRCDKLRVGTDEDAVLDHGAMLVRAIVVAGNRAGTDIDVAADGRVADVRKMINLAALADCTRLDLDEIADMNIIGEHRCRPDACIGPDATLCTNRRVLDMRKRSNCRAVSDAHIP